jgi:hypothetical protein
MARYHDAGSEFSGMITEDMGAPANMPQSVVQKVYPSNDGGLPENYEDNMKGIDKQINRDVSIAKRNAKTPKSW